MYTAQNKELK